MTSPSPWPEPEWLSSVPESERSSALLCFHISLAVLYYSKDARSYELGLALDHSEHTIYSIKKKGSISPEMAIKIEKLLGRELFPRELFRPDMFVLPQE